MIRLFLSVAICMTLLLSFSFSTEIKINGSVYTGETLSIYPNVSNTFIIEYAPGGMLNAVCENSNFSVSSEDQPSSTDLSGNSSTNGSKILVKVTLNPNTPQGKTAKVAVMPIISIGDSKPLFNFAIVSKSTPTISSIELVDGSINKIKSGDAFKLILKGKNLEDLVLKLPKEVSGKILKNKGHEVLIELKAGKNFKSMTIDKSIFALKQKNVKVNITAKPIVIK